jgi:hypothetical protein
VICKGIVARCGSWRRASAAFAVRRSCDFGRRRSRGFWIPQRGLFVIGQAFFEPFDPARHRCEVHAEA